MPSLKSPASAAPWQARQWPIFQMGQLECVAAKHATAPRFLSLPAHGLFGELLPSPLSAALPHVGCSELFKTSAIQP